MEPAILISTYPNKKTITKLANNLVKRQIVACVNVVQITSIYSWKKKIENTSEYLAIFKTTKKNVKKLKIEIKKTHPYEIPEIAEITMNSVNDSYLKWLIDSTT